MPSSACKKCALDRKSTRLNSSHLVISYAVFYLKKKTTRRCPLRAPRGPPPPPRVGGVWKEPRDSPNDVGRRRERGGRQKRCKLCFFFFNDTATTEIYTLSLHDALPIWVIYGSQQGEQGGISGEQLVSLLFSSQTIRGYTLYEILSEPSAISAALQ